MTFIKTAPHNGVLYTRVKIWFGELKLQIYCDA